MMSAESLRLDPFLIGVAGGTASGKVRGHRCLSFKQNCKFELQSNVCDKIREKLDEKYTDRLAFITEDSFYKDLTPEEHSKALQGDYNFDHPGDERINKLLIKPEY